MSQNNLCEKTLSSELSTQALELFNEIHLLQEVTSTNDYLLKQSQQQKKNLICITPLQTAGRGQRGKTWISQADDICFSLLWITQLPLEKLTGLSILTGIAIAESIQTFLPHHKIQLKWPNDLLVNKKKLGGVLIESTKHKKDSAIVIGIGINNAHAPKTNQPTTSLKELQSTHAKAESVIAAIINNLTEKFHQFATDGLNEFARAWEKYDYNLNQTVTLSSNQKTYTGVCQGISNQGAIVIRDELNKLMEFTSGSLVENATTSKL